MTKLMPELGGYTFAFFSGLFLDFFGSVMFGGYALVFTIIMFVFYRINDKIDFRDTSPQIIITAFLNMLCVIFYGLIGKIFTGDFLWQGLNSLLLGSFITGLLLPVIYLAVTRYLTFGALKNIYENKAVF
jgi:rod shape-determining protein MreD